MGPGNLRLGSVNDRSVMLRTSNTDRLLVDGSGRVTTPFQPAFLARYRPSTVPSSSGGAWTGWSDVPINTGSHFNATNGRFTAPVNGTYVFHASDYGNDYRAVAIYVNGGMYLESYIGTLVGTSCQVTAITYMNAGDYATVVYSSAPTNISAAGGLYWHFEGYLLG
jgi:hypothetical protein